MAAPLLLISAAVVGALLIGGRRAKPKAAAGTGGEPPMLEFDEEPDPSMADGMPMLGSGKYCFSPIWDGVSGGPLGPAVLALMNPAARAVVTPPATAPYYGKRRWQDSEGRFHSFAPADSWLSDSAQVLVYKAALSSLSSESRTSQSATARAVLSQLAPECDWYLDLRPTFGHYGFDKDQYNFFVSTWYLVAAASAHLGLTVRPNSLMKPVGDPRGLVIGRGYLGLWDVGTPGKVFLPAGRRIEILVGEYTPNELPRPPFFHAEPLVARVIDSGGGRPLVEILATFQGRDVTPRYSHKHGFYVGRRLRLPGTGTTAIRSILPAGAE